MFFSNRYAGIFHLVAAYLFIGNNLHIQSVNAYALGHSPYLDGLYLSTGFLDALKGSIFFEGSVFYINIFPIITASIIVHLIQVVATEKSTIKMHMATYGPAYIILLSFALVVRSSYNSYLSHLGGSITTAPSMLVYIITMLVGVSALYILMQFTYFIGLRSKSLLLILLVNLFGQVASGLIKVAMYGNVLSISGFLVLLWLCVQLQKLEPSEIYLERSRGLGSSIGVIRFLVRLNETSLLFPIIFFMLSDLAIDNLYSGFCNGISLDVFVLYLVASFFLSYLTAFALDFLLAFLMPQETVSLLSEGSGESSEIRSYFIWFQNLSGMPYIFNRYQVYSRVAYSSISTTYVFIDLCSSVTLGCKVLLIFIIARILNTFYQVLK